MKPTQDTSLDELRSTKRTLRAIVTTVLAISAVYAGYLVYVLLSGTWTRTNTLGTVPLLMMVAVIISPLTQISQINREIMRRSETPNA